ncbi:Glycosyltransferase, GT2 family [Gemmobacter megaterium]|uniref:Glycosyltransferase, GT2 family n=1 Tax=Gemmobacter megaterium TaxID=1086013 RepID=A0A1N7QGW0_9RHOB|nr:glycosyltransferase family 2 protein [Gemmobacter megaterium]GGE26183.1 hypothetical protein GCM10011345_35210 [Gemmobacter megaterium]SIT22102.1 Glycosyltransferase, GT2 family [Gemmobacter megaterium]
MPDPHIGPPADPDAAGALPRLTVATAMMGHGPVPVLPPPVAGVMQDLHVQGLPDRLPPALAALAARPDVRILPCAGRGAARSRNAALATARGEILLFADDDMVQDPAAQDQVRAAFAADPRLDILCGRLHGPDGRPHKAYGAAGRALRFWNAAKVGTPEIAVRLARVRAAGVAFDEGFGAGAQVPLGDEYVFLMDCRRAGLAGRHVALGLGVHPPHSSGLAFGPETLGWRRAVFRRALGWYWRPAFALFLFRNRHRLQRAS